MNQMPLNDRDFAEIRANVMREIERRRTRGVWLTAASVAFAVLAIVFVLIPRPIPKNAGRIAGATPKQALPVIHLSEAPAASPAPTVVAANPPKKHYRQHHRKPKPELEPIAIASSEPMTIELQTANPDIRIIWIAK